MLSRTGTAGHTKAFIYTRSWTTGGSQSAPAQGMIRTAELSVHSRIRQPPDHDDRPKSEDEIYLGSSTGGGGLLPNGGGILCENGPATCV